MAWRWIACLFFLWGLAFGQEPGAPFITNVETDLFGVHRQNWVAVRDPRGVMYFGNSRGILEFDGQRWQHIPTPGNAMVRALCTGPEGTIYYGSIGDVGHLALGPTGRVEVVSLREAIPEAHRAFNDVWQAVSTHHGIYFLTWSAIFRLDKGKITHVQGRLAPSQACELNGTLFYVDLDRGLCLLEGDTVVPLTGLGEVYDRKRIVLTPWASHELLVGRASGGFLRVDLSSLWNPATRSYDPAKASRDLVRTFPTDLDAFVKEDQAFIYRMIPLSSGTLALGTIKGGVALLDREGRLQRMINVNRGLLDQTVTNLFEDDFHNLWVTNNSGISHVELSVPQSSFGPLQNLKQVSLSALLHKGRMHIGAISGPFVQAPTRFDPKDDKQVFTPLPQGPNQIYQFLEVEGDLLATSSQGVFQVADRDVRKLPGATSFGYCLGTSRRWPGHVFSGHIGGMEVFRKRAGRWERVGGVEGIVDNVRFVAEDALGDLWAATNGKGLLRLHFSGPDPTRPALHRFGEAQGLPGPADLRPISHGQTLYVLTQKGLYVSPTPPEDQAQPGARRFTLDRDLGRTFADPPVTLYAMGFTEEGVAIINSAQGIVSLRKQPAGGWKVDGRPFAGLPVSGDRMYVAPDGTVWLPGKVLYRTDPRQSKDYDRGFHTLVRRVTSKTGVLRFEGAFGATRTTGDLRPTVFSAHQDTLAIPEIPYRENGLSFEFSALFFEKPGTTQFQYRLEGFDRDWSPWGKSTFKEYNSLAEGEYRFRVRARNVYGTLGQEAEYRFRILPPWYRTLWALLLWVGLGGLALLGVVHAFTLRLRRQKGVLEALVAKRTVELRQAKEAAEEARAVAEEAKDHAVASRDAAERANAFKSTFLATTTHELRTPLNAILGFSRMLVQGDVREVERRSFLKTIWGASESLLQLVNDLLDLNKIEAGKLDVDRVPVDLRKVLEEALVLLGHRALERRLSLLCEVDPAVPDRLLGDPLRIRQMLVNLLGNAVKFTRQGYVRARVTRPTEGTLRVEVEDSGDGIPDHILPRLFQAFSQAETAERNQGTGLGLSITRHLAHLMGGETGVHSTLGRGSTFWFTLPVAEPQVLERPQPLAGRRIHLHLQDPLLAENIALHAQRLGASLDGQGPAWHFVDQEVTLPEEGGELIRVLHPGERPQGSVPHRILNLPYGEPAFLAMVLATPEAKTTHPRPLRSGQPLKGRILLADDNHANRLLAQAILQQLGLEHTLVEDGQKAVEAFQAGPYDLVILDANMPTMGGLEAMKAIRALPGTAALPILIFTASTSTELRERYLREGFNGYLQKPADLDDFRQAVVRRLRPPEPSSPAVEHQVLLALGERLGPLAPAYLEAWNQEACQEAEILGKALAQGDREGAAAPLERLRAGALHVGCTALHQALDVLHRGLAQAPLEALQAHHQDLAPRLQEVAEAAQAIFRTQAPPAPTSGFDPMHLHRLAQVMGGREAVQGFTQELLEDCRARLLRLDEALATEDRSTLERQAHDLKSNAGNLGLSTLAELARHLEVEAPLAGMPRLRLLGEALHPAWAQALEEVAKGLEGQG